MGKPAFLRLAAAGLGTIVLIFANERLASVDVMRDTARHFVDSLTQQQRARAMFEFGDEERYNWHYVPRTRKGLPLKNMTPEQKLLAHALLSAGLSQRGYIKATTVMSLEEVLRVLENDSGERRNPEGYFFSVFGRPVSGGVWGYRIEGHHLSLNFTVVGGAVTGSPSFFGANPAEVRHGARKGLRALVREEDLGRELMSALDAGQRTQAIVSATAYRDILTEASRKAALNGQPSGLPVSRMTARQKELLEDVLKEYAGNMPPEIAAARMAKASQAGNNLHFAWAGGTERGQPHYYRIQSPTFLVEYDNTQNEANHIHSVWRDFEGDFGQDLLKLHYEGSHK